MAYDKQKAHEYYEKYRKKGLTKGRKKGKGKAKSTKTQKKSLVGLTTGGLNEQGKMQWALAKEKLTGEMNAALAKAKTPEEKDKIRAEYQNKAMEELKKMKSDASLAQAKKAKTSSAKSTSAKSSGSAKTGGSSGGSSKTSSSKNTAAADTTAAVQTLKKIQDTIDQIQAKLQNLPEEKKAEVKQTIQVQIDSIRERLKNKVTGI